MVRTQMCGGRGRAGQSAQRQELLNASFLRTADWIFPPLFRFSPMPSDDDDRWRVRWVIARVVGVSHQEVGGLPLMLHPLGHALGENLLSRRVVGCRSRDVAVVLG